MSQSRFPRLLLNPIVIIGAVLFAVTLFVAAVALFWILRPAQPIAALPTAAVTIIAAPPTTQPPPTPTASPEPEETEEGSSLTPPVPDNLAVGAYVQINGTDGDGLRLRSEPGLGGEIRFLGMETEVFVIQDGPREVDGFTWWFLVAPVDESHAGWAVANYLMLVQNP